jgi:PKD repeat protein
MKLMKSVLLFLMLVSLGVSQVPDDYLIIHLPFQGNANDESGHGNNGIVNGAVPAPDRFDRPDGAYYFDGIDDYINVPDNEIFQIIDNSVTVAIWAKVSYLTNRFFLYKGDSQTNREYSMGFQVDSLAAFGINNLGGFQENQFGVLTYDILEEDTWYHIVGTWDGTYHKIYLNGVLQGSATPEVTIGNYDSDLYIGSYGGNIERYALNGVIDDVRIYNRALTDEEVNILYSEAIVAEFSGDTTSGFSPLTVHFTDQSSTSDSLVQIRYWQWDFDNDGVIDSEEQDPQWTYTDAGYYTVSLTVSDSISEDTETKENYILVLNEGPTITAIEDVPEDQGGWVTVNFLKSFHDTDSLHGKLNSAELYTVEINDGSGWMAATSQAAYGNDQYSVLVPTTKDSTSSDDGLIDFRIIAGMEEGNFASTVMSGYSVDNLAPAIPQGLMASYGDSNTIELSWENSPDKDINNFSIYRDTEDAFDENSLPIALTTENYFIDNEAETDITYYYTVTASDYAGNQSGFAEPVSVIISAINVKPGIPTRYFIDQNYPNPFNPKTIIKYELPMTSGVKISIYNILGQKVETLVDDTKNAGYHQIEWDAADQATGIYYYEMRAGEFRITKKMSYIK